MYYNPEKNFGDKSLKEKILYYIKMGKRIRMRNVCFTAWTNIEYDKEYMRYLVVGEEVCPSTGKIHFQGYVEFWRAFDFGVVKRLLSKESHLEERKGTALEASEYCKKDNKFKEYGTLSRQGHRSDLDRVICNVEEGLPMREIAYNNPAEYIKYHKGIEKYKNLLIKPRNWVTEVIVLWGKTGTGKSRKAREITQDYWVWTPQRGSWFDGYEGHEHVIMEEFRGQLPLGMLLSLTDRYECPVQVKGGMVEFCPKRIVITSPKHPRDWYEDCATDKIDQLLRRVTNVTEVVG